MPNCFGYLLYISCTLRICNRLVSPSCSVLSKMNLNIGRFTLNDMLLYAETRDIELKIKHVSGHISTYPELFWISTHLAHYEYAFG